MVTLSEVGCRAGGRWVLEDISLKVGEGEVIGLAGPNGSGKSLLLAICATLVAPARGRVEIKGQDTRSQAAAVRRLIGYLPEEVGRYPRMTVQEDLAFFARCHDIARNARREALVDALDRWNLRPLADVEVGELSRGLLRRVALARAWLHRPPVALLDDPTGSLDAESQALLSRELRRHVSDGGSALIASHDRTVLSRWCGRVERIAGGRLSATLPLGGADEPSPSDGGDGVPSPDSLEAR